MEGKKYSKNVVRDTAKGIRYETEPFRSKKDTDKIKQYLLGKENKRDYALFVIGCNIGLRCQDLLALKVGDVSNSKRDIKDRVQIIEQKTDKLREFKLNQAAKDALLLYFDSMGEYNPENWLFPSRKGDEALEVDSVRRILKGLGEELNIRGNYGAHSLRRTFGYRVYRDNIEKDPMVLAKLQKIFNHSSPLITMRYIGITSQSIDELYDNVDV